MSSASMGSTRHSDGSPSTRVWKNTSFPLRSDIVTGFPACFTTIVVSTLGQLLTASSETAFRSITCPRLNVPSAVISTFAFASLIRSAKACTLNPAYTTLCTAPIFAQASMDTTDSTHGGR